MLVKVSQEHISKGRQCNANSCAVALAVLEELGKSVEVHYIHVSRMWMNVTIGHDELYIETPGDASSFIAEFDSNGRESVHPFEFELPDWFEWYRRAPAQVCSVNIYE